MRKFLQGAAIAWILLVVAIVAVSAPIVALLCFGDDRPLVLAGLVTFVTLGALAVVAAAIASE